MCAAWIQRTRAALKHDGARAEALMMVRLLQRAVRRRRSLGGERGAALLEVIVSAVVLFIATGATLAVLDGSARSSSVNRDRLVAANLAEQDQERMRGLSLRTLDGYSASRNVTVGGLGYTVTSATRWINDAAGFTATCTSGTDGTSDYLLLTSTVTRTSGGIGTRPQSLRSLLAPKISTVGYKGTLSVPFADRNGTPLPAVVTSATGPDRGSATSNSSGCAVFSYYSAGTYSVSYSKSGWVTPTGVTGTVTLSGLVSTGQTNFTPVQRYDRAGTVTANVRTQAGSNAGVLTAATAQKLTLTTTAADAGSGRRDFTASPDTGATSITATNLFPFAEGYAAYAGACAANDPTTYGQPAQTVDVPPAGTPSVDVLVPTIVADPPGTARITRVVATSADTDCTQAVTATAASTSALPVQVPWGKYALCADDGTNRYRRTVTTTRAPLTVVFTTGERTAGTCA